ncbi:hypothetical protein L195_g041202, partial [Trifolium pratense]
MSIEIYRSQGVMSASDFLSVSQFLAMIVLGLLCSKELLCMLFRGLLAHGFGFV